jgi:hypothetical protein
MRHACCDSKRTSVESLCFRAILLLYEPHAAKATQLNCFSEEAHHPPPPRAGNGNVITTPKERCRFMCLTCHCLTARPSLPFIATLHMRGQRMYPNADNGDVGRLKGTGKSLQSCPAPARRWTGSKQGEWSNETPHTHCLQSRSARQRSSGTRSGRRNTRSEIPREGNCETRPGSRTCLPMDRKLSLSMWSSDSIYSESQMARLAPADWDSA